MFDVAAQRGAGSVTVAHVVERSGVSRRTFYENFADREDCLLAAFEHALALASERVVPAYASESGWRERIRAGLVAFLSFLDEQPLVGRLLVSESLVVGGRTLERRGEVVVELTRIVDEGRVHAKARVLSPLTAEGVVAGALSVISARLCDGNGGSLLALTGPLMSMLVLPYLGSGWARRELGRPVPEVMRHPGESVGAFGVDPFKAVGMRLTYRTVRVLLAVADRPGASNRQVGGEAGMNDQGQISKILNRLERIGLICNTGVGAGKGMPNAWTLSGTGWQVTEGIRNHTDGLA